MSIITGGKAHHSPPHTIFSDTEEHPHRMQAEAGQETIPDVAVKAGTAILENGGETYRAEETAVRIAYSLGAVDASAFVTPTVVMVSVTDKTRQYHTLIRRITRRGVNLTKIAQVNELSRRLAQRDKRSSVTQAGRLLDLIIQAPSYSARSVICAAGLCSMFFALMFGGSWREAAAALVIGFLLRVGLNRLEHLPLNSFIVLFAAGIIISVLCELSVMLGVISSAVITMTAVLMQVVPGLAIVNAIRDLIAGDLVSGVARATDAFMTAAGLSAGTAAGLLIFSGIV